ncbi:unnamed protein product [Porites evermanni]|uniref:Apple domain-containing protein n=1 Tax=Porites evermanni TaxID=104178 RepID=A0ABN8MBL7_9CNID|nr:unnamed protein product [Porites evermanni]
MLSRMCHGVTAEQCPTPEPIHSKALKGYTFKTLINLSLFECFYYCHDEFRCQSYNYVLKENVCEMNNRIKEVKPDQFVSDPDRLYNKRGAHRVSLGSTSALPAESCEEIKICEGGDAVSGNWWLGNGSGEATLAYCDMHEPEVSDTNMWPSGTFALPRPKLGCPELNDFDWKLG